MGRLRHALLAHGQPASVTSHSGELVERTPVLTGKRLFVSHGIDGVSLRRVGTKARRGMDTVVDFDLGSKDRRVEGTLVIRSRR